MPSWLRSCLARGRLLAPLIFACGLMALPPCAEADESRQGEAAGPAAGAAPAEAPQDAVSAKDQGGGDQAEAVAPVPLGPLHDGAADDRAAAPEAPVAAAPPTENIDFAAENLEAQRKIARWTERLGWTAIIQAVLTFAGSGLLLATLWINRKASQAAMISAKAAQDSVEHMREAARIDLRAYVFVGCVQFRAETLQSSVIEIWVQNFGRTPALDLEIRWATGNKPAPLKETNAELKFKTRNISVFPNGAAEKVVTPSQYRPLERTAFSENLFPLYLHVIIRYTDVFGQRHEQPAYYVLNKGAREGFIPCAPPLPD